MWLKNPKQQLSVDLLWLAGAQSILPAIRVWASVLRGQTHRHGDDEGHPGHPVVSVHRVSSAGLHPQQHPADQQPVAAACGGRAQPGHALHPSDDINSAQPALRRMQGSHLGGNYLVKYVKKKIFPCQDCTNVQKIPTTRERFPRLQVKEAFEQAFGEMPEIWSNTSLRYFRMLRHIIRQKNPSLLDL